MPDGKGVNKCLMYVATIVDGRHKPKKYEYLVNRLVYRLLIFVIAIYTNTIK